MIDLLDSSVLIDYLRGHAEAQAVVDGSAGPVASEITRYEVLAGVKPGEEALTEHVLALRRGWTSTRESRELLQGSRANTGSRSRRSS